MFCKECGTKIDDDSKFCRACGARIEEEIEAAEDNKESLENSIKDHSEDKSQQFRLERKHIIAFVIALIIIIAITVLLVVLLNKPPKEDETPVSDASTPVEEVKDTKPVDEDDKEPEPEPDKGEEADKAFIDYLKGNTPDSSGETFWAVGNDDVEYAMRDMNGDGQNELIVRSYGYWIPDIIQYKDGKIVFSGVENMGSSGVTFINTKNQFVSGDTSHEGREQYWISTLDENGDAKEALYFSKMWDDWAESSGRQDFYKSESPDKPDFTTDDCEKIDESEYESLVKEYATEDTSIEWKKVSDIEAEEARQKTLERSEEYKNEGSVVENADDLYVKYVRGEIPDKYGKYIDTTKEIKYAFVDMDDNGQNEMFVAMDGYMLPGVFRIKDGEVEYTEINYIEPGEGDYVAAYVSKLKYYVSGIVSEDKERYWAFKIEKDYSPIASFYFEKCVDASAPGGMRYYFADTIKSSGGHYDFDVKHEDCFEFSEDDYNWQLDNTVGGSMSLEWHTPNEK